MYALHTETDVCVCATSHMFAFGTTPVSTLNLHGFYNAYENTRLTREHTALIFKADLLQGQQL